MFSSNTSQVSSDATYIEDVFSTWLYTGNGSTQTINNGIDLAGEGGLVWLKRRDNISSHVLVDSQRGISKFLRTNSIDAESTSTTNITAFNADGFSLGTATNVNSATYASWTFRKQPKFFDVVTYTGDGSATRNISHSLGSVPGCIIIKRTDSTGDWLVRHRSLYDWGMYLNLNLTSAEAASTYGVAPTQTTFNVGFNISPRGYNDSGATYVAYLFAHDAGGFGESGTDNVISCGSFTTDGSGNATVNLGWEPQWILTKRSDSSTDGDWYLVDNMRGLSGYWTTAQNLKAQSTAAETSGYSVSITSTGFQKLASDANRTQIYIAIRRGPMKTPTTGTSVFGLNARTGTNANATVTGGAGVSDAALIKNRGAAVNDLLASRLTGTGYVVTSTSSIEIAAGPTILQSNPWDVMDGVKVGSTSTITNASANTYINYLFNRAPGFFDVVCYAGTGSVRTVAHNLGVVPELMIVKRRDSQASNFAVYSAELNSLQYLELNTSSAVNSSSSIWGNTRPTSSVFTLGANSITNSSLSIYIAYLFASCPGVSKVGSYTGTGTTQQINCGFTAGARFVLIKRTDSTGDWYVWDSARGIVAGNDPYLLLNSTAAEVTSTDYIDPVSSGFEISSTAPAAINASGGSFIFLAIA